MYKFPYINLKFILNEDEHLCNVTKHAHSHTHTIHLLYKREILLNLI